ncbi:hypothetical protein ACOMHN_017040 [Nucella lapillus]
MECESRRQLWEGEVTVSFHYRVAVDLSDGQTWITPSLPDDAAVRSYEASGYLPESVEDKLRKLEAEKQSLGLQVSVLTEQVEAQSEKIVELEFQVDDRDNRLMQTQDMLQSPL